MAGVSSASAFTLVASKGLSRRLECTRRRFLAALVPMVRWQVASLGCLLWSFGWRDDRLGSLPEDAARGFRFAQCVTAGLATTISLAIAGVLAWLFHRLTRPAVRAEFRSPMQRWRRRPAPRRSGPIAPHQPRRCRGRVERLSELQAASS
jgi:hypothetical protein